MCWHGEYDFHHFQDYYSRHPFYVENSGKIGKIRPSGNTDYSFRCFLLVKTKLTQLRLPGVATHAKFMPPDIYCCTIFIREQSEMMTSELKVIRNICTLLTRIFDTIYNSFTTRMYISFKEFDTSCRATLETTYLCNLSEVTAALRFFDQNISFEWKMVKALGNLDDEHKKVTISINRNSWTNWAVRK